MDWRKESQAVIEDIQKDVKEIVLSDKLPVDDTGIYINLQTLDGDKFCIKMTSSGFEVVGKDYDQDSTNNNEVYETPYALLSAISKLYTDSFANRLSAALSNITQK